jgi:hypothetical protein
MNYSIEAIRRDSKRALMAYRRRRYEARCRKAGLTPRSIGAVVLRSIILAFIGAHAAFT